MTRVTDFAKWAMSNGGDIRSFNALLLSAQNKSGVIGGRINVALKNSSAEFLQLCYSGDWDDMFLIPSQGEIVYRD